MVNGIKLNFLYYLFILYKMILVWNENRLVIVVVKYRKLLLW